MSLCSSLPTYFSRNGSPRVAEGICRRPQKTRPQGAAAFIAFQSHGSGFSPPQNVPRQMSSPGSFQQVLDLFAKYSRRRHRTPGNLYYESVLTENSRRGKVCALTRLIARPEHSRTGVGRGNLRSHADGAGGRDGLRQGRYWGPLLFIAQQHRVPNRRKPFNSDCSCRIVRAVSTFKSPLRNTWPYFCTACHEIWAVGDKQFIVHPLEARVGDKEVTAQQGYRSPQDEYHPLCGFFSRSQLQQNLNRKGKT